MTDSVTDRLRGAANGALAWGSTGAKIGSRIHPIGTIAGAKAGAIAGAVRGAVDPEWGTGDAQTSALLAAKDISDS